MTGFSKAIQTGLTLVVFEFLFSVKEVVRNRSRFIKPKAHMERDEILFKNSIDGNQNFFEEIAILLRSGPIPDEAFLQSQNITLDMNADPKARMNEFVEQMTPKIVRAAKARSRLSDLERASSSHEFKKTPLEEVFSAAVMSWSASESELIEDSRQLRSYLPDKGFCQNSLIVLKQVGYEIVITNLLHLLVVLICGILRSLYGA